MEARWLESGLTAQSPQRPGLFKSRGGLVSGAIHTVPTGEAAFAAVSRLYFQARRLARLTSVTVGNAAVPARGNPPSAGTISCPPLAGDACKEFPKDAGTQTVHDQQHDRVFGGNGRQHVSQNVFNWNDALAGYRGGCAFHCTRACANSLATPLRRAMTACRQAA